MDNLNLNEQNSAVISEMANTEPINVATRETRQTDMTPSNESPEENLKFSIPVSDTSDEPYSLCYATPTSGLMPEQKNGTEPEKFGNVGDATKRRTPTTFEELQHLLPRTEFSSNAEKIKSCRYRACKAVSTEETLGYCPTHFTQLYNEGEINLPTQQHTTHRRPTKVNLQHNSPEKRNPQTIFQPNGDVIINDVNNLTITPGVALAVRPRTQERRKPTKERQSKDRLKRGNSDLVESGESDDDSNHGYNHGYVHKTPNREQSTKNRICMSGICSNQGLKSYNWLCADCYNVLTYHGLHQAAMPQPAIVNPGVQAFGHSKNSSEHCSCCKCVQRVSTTRQAQRMSHSQVTPMSHGHSRCQKCRGHIEGGCFCSHCFYASKGHTELFRMTEQFAKHHVLDTPSAAHRLIASRSRHQDYYVDNRVSCDCAKCMSRGSRTSESKSHDLSCDLDSEVSLASQPTHDYLNSEYIMSIGDIDYDTHTPRLYAHFPNDRG